MLVVSLMLRLFTKYFKSMKTYCFLIIIGLLSLQTALNAQVEKKFKWEFGLDLTPVIALPYAENGSNLGFEIIIRRQLTDKHKLRIRYEVNRESNGQTPEDQFNFNNTIIHPAPDGSPRSIANVHYQGDNHGMYIGWQKAFSVQGFKMYWGTDLNGQINSGEVWSEILLEGEQPFNPIASPLLQQDPFSGVVNTYHNFQLGIIPFLGIDVPLGERFNFMLECGPKLGFLWSSIPFISDFEQINYRNSQDFFMQAFPVKDIAIAYRF